LAEFLGGEERLEQPRPCRAIDTDTGVGHREHHIATGLDRPVLPRVRGVEIHGGGLDRELAAARHGVARVDDQVHDDLLELPGIGSDGGARCRKSTEPRMAVSRLLKSWAIPPARRPTASIFCVWRNRSSRARCSVTSSTMNSKHSIAPSGPRTGRPLRRTVMTLPSRRLQATSSMAEPNCSQRATMRARAAGSTY